MGDIADDIGAQKMPVCARNDNMEAPSRVGCRARIMRRYVRWGSTHTCRRATDHPPAPTGPVERNGGPSRVDRWFGHFSLPGGDRREAPGTAPPARRVG